MKKKRVKITNEDLLKAINGGFNSREKRMATKEDLKGFATREDLANMEVRLTNKIDKVQESVKTLEEVDVLDLQKRVQKNEKDIRTLTIRNS